MNILFVSYAKIVLMVSLHKRKVWFRVLERTCVVNINYIECCKYIEKMNDIALFQYQRDIIRGWCEGNEVRTCRGAGRSMLARGFGKYVTSILENNNYEANPEVVIPFPRLIECAKIQNLIMPK